jgi:hypothetical protein
MPVPNSSMTGEYETSVLIVLLVPDKSMSSRLVFMEVLGVVSIYTKKASRR